MANGYFERGEVYWVNLGSGFAAEKGVGRPAVIVSKDESNNASPCVMVALFTTKYHDKPWEVYTNVTGRDSWIMCNEVMTYDKARVGKYFGKLSFSEMRAVEDGLEQVFDLGYADTEALNAKDDEIAKLKAQIVELTNEVAREQARVIEVQAKHDEELLSYKVENAMWQKCYERSLDQLVKMKVSADVAMRVNGVVGSSVSEPPKAPKIDTPVEQNPPAEVPVEDTRLDINTASATALKKVGFSVALAKAVVKARPFASVEDLKKVPGMAKTKYQILAPKLCCVPVVVVEPEEPFVVEPEEPEVTEEPRGKLNINVALAKEIHEFTGLALSTCYRITKYRNDNGPYQKLEDLLNAPQVFPGTLEKIRDKIEVGPSLSEDSVEGERNEPCGGKKLNVNTATLEELMSTGMGYNAASRIRAYRNKHGNFEKLEDLLNVGRFGERALEKYRSVLEV